MQCFYSLIIELEEKLGGNFEEFCNEGNETVSEEQLSVVIPPFLPDLPQEKKSSTYTLVLDLDETLVHYEEVTYFREKFDKLLKICGFLMNLVRRRVGTVLIAALFRDFY